MANASSSSITKLITDSKNNLFCISNRNIYNNPVLYKYENLEWVQKGTFLGDYTNFNYDQYSMDIDAKIDSNDNIIVAYLKPVYDKFYVEFYGYDLYVSRYSPITHLWTQLGATKINDTTLIHMDGEIPLAQISMEIINDEIYVAYTKIVMVMGENGPIGPEEVTITVKKYISLTDEWVDTGSTAKIDEMMSGIPYLKKDNNNILHLLYMSIVDGEIKNARASIKQYSGGVWIPYLTDISAEHTIGIVWSSAGKARHCLHFDGMNTPHVLYTSVVYPDQQEEGGDTSAIVIYATHNGIAWVETSFEENSGSCCILEDNDGVLYCAYNVSDLFNSTSHIQIMKKIDGTWVLHEGNLENVSFYVSPADIIFKLNNELIISYSDANANERPTVSSYGVRPFTPFRATFGTTSPEETVILPLIEGYDYNFTIDWGDGTTNTIEGFDDSNREHSYAEAGTYRVMIRGKMPVWKYYDPSGGTNNGTPQHLISIDDWGNVGYGLKVQNFDYMFFNCINLESIPELNVAGQMLRGMFGNCVSLTDAILKNISSSVSYMETAIPIDDRRFETIFDNLYPNYTSFNQPTIGIPAGAIPQTLTDKATDKGWIIQQPKPKPTE